MGVTLNVFSGQRAWLLQRVSGVILLVAAICGIVTTCLQPVLTFAHWRTLAASFTGAAFILVGYVAACVHAWIGARDVALDYLSHKGLRLLILTVIGGGLIATPIRVLFILARLA